MKLFHFTAIPLDQPTAEPVFFDLSANSKDEAVLLFFHSYPEYTYIRVKEYNELSKEMIDGAVDDDIDNMFNPFIGNGEEIPASEIFKKMRPNDYGKFRTEYCNRYNILIEAFNDGRIRYFELPED